MLETSNKNFDSFYLSDEMLHALKSVAYHTPTPAQVASIPLIMAGIDIIVQAQTGSGKTAAFAIPVIEMLEHNPGKIEVLVIVPTRELAGQVSKEFQRLGAFKHLSATAIYGGTSYEAQHEALKTAQIVVATPGRLLDHINRGTIVLKDLRILCLDEADEMLSMGFRDDIEAVITHLPEERQSLLFSATITDDIKNLANRILFYPEFITLSTDSVATSDVTHVYYNVRGVGRPRDLIKVIEFADPDSAIIFANTKDDTFTVTSFLKRHGYRADVLNGDLPQSEREKTLAALRSGKIDFIVATDVAARGIDISDLSHVFNYALPDSAEVYIHRSGRTGRAGKKGIAISLIAPTEVTTFFQITKLYDVKMQKREMPTTLDIVKARQASALERLSDRLDGYARLPFSSKLGMAEQLLGKPLEAPSTETPTEHEHVKLVARLLALADRVLQKADSTPLERTAEPAIQTAPAKPVIAEPAKVVESAKTVDAEKPAPKPEESAPKTAPMVQKAAEETAAPHMFAEKPEAIAEPKPVIMVPRQERSERSERGRRTARETTPAQSTTSIPEAEKLIFEQPTPVRERTSHFDQPAAAPSSQRQARAERPVRMERADASEQATPPAAGEEAFVTQHSDEEPQRPKRIRTRKSRPSRGSHSTITRTSEHHAPAVEPESTPIVTKASESRAETRLETRIEPVAPEAIADTNMRKLYINIGREQLSNSHAVLDMICYMAGVDPEDIGEISLESTYSYVQVRRDYFHDIIAALNQQDWEGTTLTAQPARK